MKFILKRRLRYCTKEFIKVFKIMAVALIFIIGIILTKYKPLYKVSINNTKIGYVSNKEELNGLIKEYEESKEGNIAFITINSEPVYELNLVSNKQDTNEEEILESIKEDATKTYTAYGITINDDIKAYVETEEEAENIINSFNEKYEKEKTEFNVGVKQIYTEEIIDISDNDKAIETVTTIADNTIKEKEEQRKIELAKNKNNTGTSTKTTISSLSDEEVLSILKETTLAVKPVTGSLTSRFGERSSVRSSVHTGLDIAVSSGTPIKSCGSGTVIFADYKGSYGNLVKIDHGNGIETWYGHCSKIYVTAGQSVSAGDVIAAVGSTGNSTGPHLHFEIRINGEAVNPQKYLYE